MLAKVRVLGLEVGVELGRLLGGFRIFLRLIGRLHRFVGHLANPMAFIIIFIGPGISSLLSMTWNCANCSQSDCW